MHETPKTIKVVLDVSKTTLTLLINTKKSLLSNEKETMSRHDYKFPGKVLGREALKELKSCGNYDTIFSNSKQPRKQTERRTTASPHTPTQCSNLKSVENIKQMMEVQGSHRTLFYRQPSRKHISSYSTVNVDLENVKGSSRKVTFESETDPSTPEGISKKEKSSVVITLPVKSEKMATRGTQTDFRESEAQTLPWKHEIRAHGRILAELMALDWFNLERNFPPGMEEVTLIEKTRQKLAWESVIERMAGKGNESRRRFLVGCIAAAETADKEKKMEETHRERINLSRRQMEEANNEFEERLVKRLQKSYVSRRKENNERIDYWNHQLARKLRKIKSRIKTERRDIISIHLDKTSELYAPKLRDGENPSRGHEVIDIKCRYLKRFHGLLILEKHLSRVLQPRFFGFNYEEASKPKKIELCLRKYRERAIDLPKEESLEQIQLKIPVPATTPEPPPTPRIAGPKSDSEENLYQVSLFLAKLIKGRAIQTKKFLEFTKMASE